MAEPRILNIRDLVGSPWPADVVRIDRGSRWGNPHRIGTTWIIEENGVEHTVTFDRELAILLYRGHAVAALGRDPAWLEPLRGKRLACWCAPLPCHGDVLVELLGG